MRVGVLTSVQHSMFSSGCTNTALAVAEALKAGGASVDLVNYARGSQKWWDDCKTLADTFHVVRLPDASGYDLLIEVDQYNIPPTERARIAKKSVWLPRHSFLLEELEASLFPTTAVMKRDLSGVSEIWCFDAVTRAQDLQTLEALFHLPVKRLPFLWSPSPAQTLLAELGGPTWLESAQALLDTRALEPEKIPWAVHCMETNTTNTSSAILPAVIIREAARQGVPLASWKIHNAELLKQAQFFMENTAKHCFDMGPSGELIGRQRIPGWATEPFSLVLSHIRFNSIRVSQLDTLWCGIPLVHNSPFLATLEGLERYSYTDNHVGEAVSALRAVQEDYKAGTGLFAAGALEKIRATLVARYGPTSFGATAWVREARALMGETIPTLRSTMKTEGVLRIGFSDMWADFNPEYNFFTLLLAEAGAAISPPIQVIGQAATGDEDIVLFGPFGLEWQKLPVEVPKVHFTGENTVPVGGPGVVLNLGFQHFNMVGDEYLRFPLWLLYIDWFGADAARLGGPIPIPLESCTKVSATDLDRKKKFCAFVVTNPGNPVRNTAFQWLSEYKQVDSAGRLFNNVGGDIFAGFGGGGGELAKFEFLKDYKFSITYENSAAKGYCTEKYLHAKAAGCIPIYWGDPWFERDFDLKGCIDARKFRTPEELIEAVRNVDTDDAEWLRRFATPALDSYRVGLARRTLAECARRMFAAVGCPMDRFPRFLGATGKVATAVTAAAAPVTAPNPAVPDTSGTLKANLQIPMPVTYTNAKFFHNLHFWLLALNGHKRTLPDLKALIYLGADVPEEKVAPIQEKFPFAVFRRTPEHEVPTGFPDFWDPAHYGFKLWIYNALAHDTDLSGQLILYTDVASFLSRWPTPWLQKARDTGLCFLEDPREENARWCSPVFQTKMSLTAEEIAAKQRLGGLVAFRAGSPLACAVFAEAYRLGQDREILAGPKWSGVGADGKPFGHRHDQSILSILSLRYEVPVEPLDSVYCDVSLRATHKSGRAVYVHRGNFQIHRPALPGIDEIHVINLERRADRLQRLLTTHPDLSGVVERWPAVDGRALTLTPAIAKVLAPNDFFWKKAVAGCALSHLGLWWKLANEQPEIKSFLILEDDVKFKDGWSDAWKSAVAAGAIPDDADIVYLGGVLPPNRAGFVKERVNDHVARVAPNQCFGQAEPTRYFHFCAYAYVLTKAGAQKVIGLLNGSGGYWTSADHILCNPVDVLTSYVLDPMVAGCYQDDDPKYATSNFNDFSRVDSFDSDLWNNDERFSTEEIAAALKGAANFEALPFQEALADAARGGPVEPKEKKEVRGTGICVPYAASEPHRFLNRPILAHGDSSLELTKLYEYEWLMNLFGNPTLCNAEPVLPSAPPPPEGVSPLILLQGSERILELDMMLERWNEFGATFYILHLSDEWGRDSVASYDLSGCLGVIRTYQRADLDGHPKVLTIPLGYHWTLAEGSKNPLTLTPRLPFRTLHWSFFGTGWKNRVALLSPLVRKGLEHRVKFLDQWNDPEQLTHEEYIGTMLNSVFVPCPEGMNAETFRFYETLECGALPLVVETETSALWIAWLKKKLPLQTHTSWDSAAEWMLSITKKSEELEAYRDSVLQAWIAWRVEVQEQVQQWVRAEDPSGNMKTIG